MPPPDLLSEVVSAAFFPLQTRGLDHRRRRHHLRPPPCEKEEEEEEEERANNHPRHCGRKPSTVLASLLRYRADSKERRKLHLK